MANVRAWPGLWGVAAQPMPYTESVGTTTTPPARRTLPPRLTAAASGAAWSTLTTFSRSSSARSVWASTVEARSPSRTATSTRGRCVRSCRTSTEAQPPCRRQSSAASPTFVSNSSTHSMPPGRSAVGASSSSRLNTSSPSGPPSSARCGSCASTSAGSVGTTAEGMYGGFDTSTSSAPMYAGSTPSARSQRTTSTAPSSPSASRLRSASAAAFGETSVATTCVPCRSLAMEHAMHPVPVPTSSTRASRPQARAASTPSSAASTRTSVSGRGMSTPSSHCSTMWRNGISPVMYCSGAPVPRRTTASCMRRSSSGVSGRSKLVYICTRESPVTEPSIHSADRRGRSSPLRPK